MKNSDENPHWLAELQIGHKRQVRAYSPAVEDYLEIIYGLITTKGYAKAVDIATYVHARPPTVTKMLQRLHSGKLIVYEKYRRVSLTSRGESLAKGIRERHELLVDFLRLLGIDGETAKIDVCATDGLEHSLNPKTLEKIRKFVNYVKAHPQWFAEYSQSTSAARA